MKTDTQAPRLLERPRARRHMAIRELTRRRSFSSWAADSAGCSGLGGRGGLRTTAGVSSALVDPGGKASGTRTRSGTGELLGVTSWGGVSRAAVASSDVTVRNLVAGQARTPQDSVTVSSLRLSVFGRGRERGMGSSHLENMQAAGLGWAGVPRSTGLEGPGCAKPAEDVPLALAWVASFR